MRRHSLPILSLYLILICFVASPAYGQRSASDQTHPKAPAGSQLMLGEASSIMASVNDATITASQLEGAIGNRLQNIYSQIYLQKREVLEGLIAETLIQHEARARGVSTEALLAVEIDAKVKPVTPEEVRAIFEASSNLSPNRSAADVLAQIENGMRLQRLRLRRDEFLKGLRSRANVTVFMDPPRVLVNPGNGPSWGPADASVTVVEFTDFQCPFCAKSLNTVKQLQAQYNDKVRFVFKDFPLPSHPDAGLAAEAARCAGEQKRFWEMHDKLFANQQRLKLADIRRYSQEVGLNVPAFDDCLESQRHRAGWQQDKREGESYGVSGTPAFLVNGRLIVGTVPFDVLARTIEEELNNSRVSHSTDRR